PFNTSENEGAICITADGKSIYFTACGRSNGFGSCDIYESHLKSGQWTSPKNLGESVNSGYWESQPAISPDGKRLFFVSNRPGGFGKRDIWFVEKEADGNWSSPYNCGENINTKQDEMSPFMHWDNRHFYFATRGRFSLGGYDLYLSENQIEKSRFSKPKHLPFPFNSPFDDNSLVVEHDGKTAYFISEQVRDSSLSHDVFSCSLPKEFQSKEVQFLSADIVDAHNKNIVENADVLIKTLATNETVYEGIATYGHFYACLDPNEAYAVFISKPKYMYYSAYVPKPENPKKLWQAKFELQALNIGEKMPLNALFFAFDSDELLPSSQPELEALIDLLETNPNLQIKLIGHTDDLGEADYNLNLSTKRAQAIKNALLNFGVNPERILTEGKGETAPLVENKSDENRAKNRRTELKIIAL
ncbi:MAG: OmpA family protein, partial [Flavobacteriales bacterium]